MPNIKSALISRPLPPIRENSTLSISPRGAIPTRNPLDQSGGESSVSDSDSSDTEVSPISTVMQGILIGSAGQEVEARSAEELMASDVRGNTVDIAHSDEEKNKDRTERLLRPGGDAPSDDTAPLLASRPFPIRGAQVPRHEKSGKTKARESRATTKLRRMPETSSAEPSRPSGMQAINRAGSPGALSNEPNDEGNSGASEDQDEENGCCFNYMYCCAQSNRQMHSAADGPSHLNIIKIQSKYQDAFHDLALGFWMKWLQLNLSLVAG
ncbi:hypothetical protein JHW43_008726 [Diplocarpon mali]|nr:hypothetical protein JHW43_008726 [Diplocarpon mali]